MRTIWMVLLLVLTAFVPACSVLDPQDEVSLYDKMSMLPPAQKQAITRQTRIFRAVEYLNGWKMKDKDGNVLLPQDGGLSCTDPDDPSKTQFFKFTYSEIVQALMDAWSGSIDPLDLYKTVFHALMKPKVTWLHEKTGKIWSCKLTGPLHIALTEVEGIVAEIDKPNDDTLRFALQGLFQVAWLAQFAIDFIPLFCLLSEGPNNIYCTDGTPGTPTPTVPTPAPDYNGDAP